MTSSSSGNTTSMPDATSEYLATTYTMTRLTTTGDAFDVAQRFVVGIVAVIVYLVLVFSITLTCFLYKRCRWRSAAPKHTTTALSIAEYCNRSYNSASASSLPDEIFSVHFTSATGTVRLPTVSDRQRLDADFDPASEDDICPYATFAEIAHLRAPATLTVTDVSTSPGPRQHQPGNGEVDAGRRRTGRHYPRVTEGRGDADRQAVRRPSLEDDLSALYARPHKLIARNSVGLTAEPSQPPNNL